MSKTVRTQTTVIELEQENGNPFALMVKRFLGEGQDPNEDMLADYTLNVKVQKLDKYGKPYHGVKFRTSELVTGENDIFDQILDDPELGPGRYTFFVEYEKLGEKTPPGKEPPVVIVRDVRIGGAPFPTFQTSGNPPGDREGGNDTANMLALLMQSMQESNKLITGVLTALINKQSGGAQELLNAIKLGSDLAGRVVDEVGDGEQDPVNRLLDIGAPVVKVLLEKVLAGDNNGVIQAAEEVRKLTGEEEPKPS